MRIVSGEFKGRPISAPSGRGTRPTTDRMRETVFNILAHAEWAPTLDGARIMDLFAGSGALGLEALSRGAAFCLFVETDSKARGAIRDNIETLGLYGVTRLHRRSATDLGDKPAGLGEPFEMVFLDPPYSKGLAPRCLQALVKGQWLTANAVAMVETAIEDDLSPDGWTLLDERTQAQSKISFLQRND